MAMQEDQGRYSMSEQLRRHEASEMVFRKQLEWRDPLFHYDPDGPAVLAMEAHLSRAINPTSFSSDVSRRLFESRQRQEQERAIKERHRAVEIWTEYWERFSRNCQWNVSGWEQDPPPLVPFSSSFGGPLVPLEQERHIVETTRAIARSKEVEVYQEAGRNWHVPRGNLIVPLPDGNSWVDMSSTDGVHSSGGSSASAHFVYSMDEMAQSPALAAVMALAGNRRDTKILYVASSYGLGLKMLQLAGFTNITGVDIDENAVEFSQSQGLDAKAMDASHMDFPDETFDVVVSRNFLVTNYAPYPNTIEQGVDRVPFLDEQHRVVRNGGAIVLTTGHESSPLDLRLLPTEDIVNSRLQNARHAVATGLVRRPMIHGREFYPIWIFQK